MLLTILAIAATLVAVTIALLTIGAIVDWFRSRNDILESDKDKVAVTIQEALQSGNYRTVQAIYDRDTDTVVDIRKVDAKSVDEKVRAAHQDSDLVVWKI
jgi:hypothetical protein